MTSNPKPEREKCPHDGHLLDRTGKCWYCGGIYPAGKPALTVVESEHQVEVETSMESVEATISVQKDDGTFTEPVPFDSFRKAVNGLTERVDPETGELQEPAGQMVLGDDPAFVRVPMRKSVPITRVTAYMPGPHAAWVKRSEKDEGTRERREWWEHEGRIGLKVVDLGSMEVTDEEWSDD